MKTVVEGLHQRTFEYVDETLALDYELISGYGEDDYVLRRNYSDGSVGMGVKGRNNGFTLGSLDDPTRDHHVGYRYNAVGLLEKVIDASSTYSYDYWENSTLIKTLDHEAIGLHIAYEYEPNRNLVTNISNSVSEQLISEYAYVYDEIGRRKSMSHQGEAFSQPETSIWAYNDRNELTGQNRYEGFDPDALGAAIPEAAYSYNFDNIGNRLSATKAGISETYLPDRLNQYKTIDNDALSTTLSPKYDEDGNMLTDGGWFYEWDAENRMIGAQDFEQTPLEGSMYISFEYDYLSRRTRKHVETYVSGAWQSKYDNTFIYDGWSMILERSEIRNQKLKRRSRLPLA